MDITHDQPDDPEICGDILRPIPNEEWICVRPPGHEPMEHVAQDETRW